MGSSDLNDQLQSYYLTTVRSRNWQHRIPIFSKLLWWSCLYCTKYEQGGAKLPFNDFIARLVSEWVSITPSVVKKSSIAFVPLLATRSQGCHVPEKLSAPNMHSVNVAVKRYARRFCAVYRVKKTSYLCKTCDRALCITDNDDDICCWETWYSGRDVASI